MTGEDEFIGFVLSRLFSGLFGSVPSAVGGGLILDVFFLHQRGLCFLCYTVSLFAGAATSPTFSGFIAGTTAWIWCFWWTVPLLAVTILLVFLFAEETGFDRERGVPPDGVRIARSWVSRRVAIFFPGTAVVRTPSVGEVVS